METELLLTLPCNAIPGHTSGEKHDLKGHVHPMLTAALFTIVKTRKPPKWPSTEDWIKTQYYMCSSSQTSLPTSSPSHPPGSSQCTGPERPVSCIKPGLVIYFIYDNIHVLMLFSQTSHPRLLPQSPKVCSVYLCLLLSQI